jgi:hypothetical protein
MGQLTKLLGKDIILAAVAASFNNEEKCRSFGQRSYIFEVLTNYSYALSKILLSAAKGILAEMALNACLHHL